MIYDKTAKVEFVGYVLEEENDTLQIKVPTGDRLYDIYTIRKMFVKEINFNYEKGDVVKWNSPDGISSVKGVLEHSEVNAFGELTIAAGEFIKVNAPIEECELIKKAN